MSLRQQSASAAAFEIRFSTTDSELEIFEIQTDNNLHERNVPDPFKKRDKIPRSSGSMEQFIISDNNNNSNSNSNNSNSNNSNNNITAAVRHSSLDSQTSPLILKSRRHVNGDNLNSPSKKVMSTNSDQISSLKAKSSNAVGPEAINGIIKNSNVDVNASDDDSISRNTQYKKLRSPKIDEIASEKEGKVVSNHQITELNGKTEPVVSNNKIIMPKNTLKNKKINMLTNNYNDDENKSLATPPATPPFTPHISSMAPLSESDIINLEEPQLVTPPSSSSARSSGESISRVTQQMPRSSKKRRGSQSSQLSIEFQPAAKLQAPRGRKLSSTERPITISEQSQTTQLPIKSKETQTSQQSQPIPIKSRIPRLSLSSRDRPVIAKKESEGSLSLSSQDLNRYDNPNESLSSSYPITSMSQPPRELRSAISRPIINTSFMTDMEVESESPMSYSPSSYSSTGYSPTSYSPTTMSQSLPKHSQISHTSPPIRSSTSPQVYQKKLISHDDVIIPTIAKKLKMNGQLHFVNHDALLGYSEEPEDISPTSENGYMDITDQVVDLFDGSGSKSHKSQLPVNGSQRRIQQSVRKNSSTGHSRNSSKTHYIVPRKQNYKPPAEESSNPTNTQSSNRPMFVDDDFNKQRKSRREEYIMVIQDDDDDNNMESNDPHSSVPLDPSVPSIPSEPIIAPTEQVESNDQIYQEKVEEPVSVQKMSVMQETLNPTEVTTVPTVTSGKIKKGKKKQKKGSSEKHNKGNGEPDEENVRRSICRCM